MGRGQISTLAGVWKMLIPTLMDSFEGFEISVHEVTAAVMEIELGIEVELKDVTELLQSHCKILMDEELLLMNKQRKCFLEIDYIPGIDVVMTVEMTKK